MRVDDSPKHSQTSLYLSTDYVSLIAEPLNLLTMRISVWSPISGIGQFKLVRTGLFYVTDMMPFWHSPRSFTPNTRKDFVKHLQVQLTGISTAVPEFLKPMVKRGRFVVPGGPIWRRCLPDMREVLNLKLLQYANSVSSRLYVHESHRGTWQRTFVGPSALTGGLAGCSEKLMPTHFSITGLTAVGRYASIRSDVSILNWRTGVVVRGQESRQRSNNRL